MEFYRGDFNGRELAQVLQGATVAYYASSSLADYDLSTSEAVCKLVDRAPVKQLRPETRFISGLSLNSMTYIIRYTYIYIYIRYEANRLMITLRVMIAIVVVTIIVTWLGCLRGGIRSLGDVERLFREVRQLERPQRLGPGV